MKSILDFQFKFPTEGLSEDEQAKLMTIWREDAGLEERDALARLGEVVLLVKTVSGDLAGVATAVKMYIPQLQNNLYAYRCFIRPSFRAPALDTQMLVKSRDYLEALSLSDVPPRCIGVILFVQNETIKKYWRQAIWPGANMMYIGDTPQGHHMRVCYFKGARV